MRKIRTIGLAVLGLTLAGLTLAGCNQTSHDDETLKALTAVQDRLAIEDLLVDYYSHLGSGSHEGLDQFFTEDAVFSVNGIVLRGHEEIQGIYARTASPTAEATPVAPEKTHVDFMHLTNPVIKVNGDRATAKVYWTGIVSDDLNAPPVFEEMGREYDLLVKRDGQWRIAKRTVIADAGMPKSMNDTYKRMPDYDITKDN